MHYVQLNSATILPASKDALRAPLAAATQLHATLCRCTQWVAGGAAQHLGTLSDCRLQLLVPLVNAAESMRMLSTASAGAFSDRGPAEELLLRQEQAVGVASWEAVQALVEGHEAALLGDPRECVALICALSAAAKLGPAAVGGSPELLRLLREALSRLEQGWRRQRACHAAVQAAEGSPHLTAALLAAGLLWPVVQGVRVEPSSGRPDMIVCGG
ncbi:hypothetical protein ABPG75_002785 [Micractinium tetrahymenae]